MVSGYQRRPEISLALIGASGVRRDAGIIDVGGGASTLVDDLPADGYTRLAVLDLSGVGSGDSATALGKNLRRRLRPPRESRRPAWEDGFSLPRGFQLGSEAPSLLRERDAAGGNVAVIVP